MIKLFISIVALSFLTACAGESSRHAVEVSKQIAEANKAIEENMKLSEEINKQFESLEKASQDEKSVNKDWQKYFYPNMSYCGGSLYGYYSSGELQRIESTYGAEFGYSERDVIFENGKIKEIKYHEHNADYEKYRRQYPNDEGFEPDKLTYSDTSYILIFSPRKDFKKFAGRKLISSKVPQSLVDQLVDCAGTMKKELETEKELVKE
jgi:hypothetical protein